MVNENELIFTSLLEDEKPDEYYVYKCPYCPYCYGEEKNGVLKLDFNEDFICRNPKCQKEIKIGGLRKIDRSPKPRFPYELGVPHEVVRDLFLLSNLFIFPTLSENCPLILLEAAFAKCLLVLNDDFPPLKDFFGENALYFKFSSILTKTTYNNEEQYFSDVAKIIIGELNKNKPLNAFNVLKQKFNFDYIFKSKLEPLFYEQK